MSEPTIKPVGCLKCGWRRGVIVPLPLGTFRCFGCGADSPSLYTHDDLVFAVALTIATLTGASKEASMVKAAEAVDGLTGVKR